MNKGIIIAVVLSFMLAACGGTKKETKRVNDRRDLNDARKITNKYYKYYDQSDFEKILALFSDSAIIEGGGRQAMLDRMADNRKTLGAMVDYFPKNWLTSVSDRPEPYGDYMLHFCIQYPDSVFTNEVFFLKRDGKGKIRIADLQIYRLDFTSDPDEVDEAELPASDSLPEPAEQPQYPE